MTSCLVDVQRHALNKKMRGSNALLRSPAGIATIAACLGASYFIFFYGSSPHVSDRKVEGLRANPEDISIRPDEDAQIAPGKCNDMIKSEGGVSAFAAQQLDALTRKVSLLEGKPHQREGGGGGLRCHVSHTLSCPPAIPPPSAHSVIQCCLSANR